MILKEGRYFTLQCDYCSNIVDELEDFQEAVDYKKQNGWKSKYLGDDCWVDVCPNCIEKGVLNE